MKSIEIFSGAGGLAKGLENSGFGHVAFVESNKDACASLRLNFQSDKVFHGDIRDFDLSHISGIDLLAGGPPCQPFSLGGKHKANHDSRDMFPYAINLIERLKPKAFILENVKGLLRSSFSDYYEYILLRLSYPDFQCPIKSNWKKHLKLLRDLKSHGYKGQWYNVSYKLLNAANYGVPQTRERAFIVGVRSNIKKHWKFPEPEYSEDRLIWEQYISGGYWDRHGISRPDYSTLDRRTRLKIDRVRHIYGMFQPEEKAWHTLRDALAGTPDPRKSQLISDHIFKDGARSYPGHTGSEIDWPSKTIKAGGHGVPGGENMIRFEDGFIRYLTVYEAKLLQTFPKDFKVTGAWGEAMRQIGNAVPVLLAEKVGRSIYSLISKGPIELADQNINSNNSAEFPEIGAQV